MKEKRDLFQRFAGKTSSLGGVLFILCITGCSGKTPSTVTPTPQPSPQTYLAPFVAGTTNAGTILLGTETYMIDDAANNFSQTTYPPMPPVGPQVVNSGMFATSSRRLLSLGITANYAPTSGSTYTATPYDPPKSGSFALELAGQAGGFMQVTGQPVAPLVAAMQCPNLKSPQTYQFVTIPAAAISTSPNTVQQPFTWDPKTQTAYGSVDISSSGSAVTFNNIHQFTLPSVGGSGAPAQPATSPVSGACSSTFLGNTISLPNPLIITNPGNSQKTPPSATVGIGPTGLLVEDNGAIGSGSTTGQYEADLGAGTGAVGLPKSNSALDTGAVVGAQYLGFVYGAGKYPGNSSSPTGWSSHLTSFGFPAVPASCASTAPVASTLIYGGDFTGEDPSAYANGYGNCDLAIDLGSQDTANNGLYLNATVWMRADYAANTSKKTYSFPAIAIAGQLNGKYAIFLIGVDSTQPWAIYLLQSN